LNKIRSRHNFIHGDNLILQINFVGFG